MPEHPEPREQFEVDVADEYYRHDPVGPDCPFCARVDAGEFETLYNAVVARFAPLNPVTAGHMLFVPAWHVEHPSGEGVRVTMGYAEMYASRKREAYNLITSSGAAATQTIAHLHVHYIPRRHADGLILPWTRGPAEG